MKRIYKNTDLNFPISLLPVTENEELIVKFFTRSDKQFIQKTKDDIIDGHIMLAWSEIATLDEGVLNAWTLISSHDNNLPDDSYDVAEVTNTPYYVVTNQKSEWDDSIENTILNNFYTKSEVDEKLSNLDVDVDLSDYALQSDLLELSGGVIDNEAVIAAALTELKETKLDKTEVPSFEGYATEAWVNEQLKDVEVDVDLTDYYTKVEVDEALQNLSVDLTGYATEQWVEDKGYLTGVDLSNYATESWVNEQLQDVEVDLTGFCYKQILTQAEYDALEEKDPQTIYIISDAPDTGGGTVNVDLTNYYNKQEVDDKVANVTVDLTGYATESWVKTQNYLTTIPSQYVTEGELSDMGYATESWVEGKDYVNHIALTKDEYAAITPEANTMYIITDVLDEWVGTQSEYDALENKNPDTTYYITE